MRPWSTIILLDDSLMQISPSPILVLNRAVAIAQRDGENAPSSRKPDRTAMSACDRSLTSA
jgi:predicted RNA polymerase sigma factor